MTHSAVKFNSPAALSVYKDRLSSRLMVDKELAKTLKQERWRITTDIGAHRYWPNILVPGFTVYRNGQRMWFKFSLQSAIRSVARVAGK